MLLSLLIIMMMVVVACVLTTAAAKVGIIKRWVLTFSFEMLGWRWPLQIIL